MQKNKLQAYIDILLGNAPAPYSLVLSPDDYHAKLQEAISIWPPVKSVRNGTFKFTADNGVQSLCDVTIFDMGHRNPYVVLFTDRPEHVGSSVTNSAEVLTQAIAMYTNDVNRGFIWVEKYPDEEHYSRIIFKSYDSTKRRCVGPEWSHLSAEDFVALIGGV